MPPRRSLRIRQLNSQTASTAVVSPASTDETTKSTENAAKKRPRTKNTSETDASIDDVAIQPKRQKKMKFKNDENDSCASMSVPSVKTTTLESFPVEVLEEIFIRIDDIGLLNCVDTCTRFEAIALAVAEKRSFVINGDRLGGDPEIYAAIFNRFGSSIEAIEVNQIKGIDANHWMAKMLQPHVSHITKLTLNECTFIKRNIFSLPMDNITHLVLKDFYDFDNLIACRKLVKLELLHTLPQNIFKFFKEISKQIIRNNPGLQSILWDKFDILWLEENSITDNLSQIKELGVVNLDWMIKRPVAVDRIVYTLKNLESLTLDVHADMLEPMQRLGLECKRIKHLKLHCYQLLWNIEAIKAIRSFQRVGSLNLIYIDHDLIDKVVSALKYLPNLRHLRIELLTCSLLECFSNILPLLRECPSLERIIVVLLEPEYKFVGTQFFKEFIETITITGKSNARIGVEESGEIIGSFSQNGVVWRNKLMHWMDCDRIPNSSNIHLLNLAKELEKSDVGRKSTKKQRQNAVRRNLLDRIFDYLDIVSLYSFAETDPRCKQLVESYIKMHSKQNGTFTITSDFESFGQDENITTMFAPHVTNLRVNIYFGYSHFIESFTRSCVRLTKVSIHGDRIQWRLPESVRHVIYDGPQFVDFSTLQEFQYKIDTLELKKAGIFNDHKRFKMDDLKPKKLIFNYRGEKQIENLKKMFKDTETQLVPIIPNSKHI